MKFLIPLLLAFSLVTGAALAQDREPTPEERAYKFRTSLFQTFAWKYGRLATAKAQGDGDAFQKHAADLGYLATMLEEGFAINSSLPEGTAAKPEIWEDFDTFKEKAGVLRAAAADLQQEGAMSSFDAKEFGSQKCGGCHRKFRVKK
ncbi:MAG: cytochrome c [Gammaproteobacteria bacterium]|nr:cytochrome c [Gammaproteobacteria bacterium]